MGIMETIASRMRGARRPKPISKYDLGSGGAGAGDAGDARRAGRFGFFSRRSATDERGRGGMFGRKTGGANPAGDLVRRAHAGAETREELERLPDDVLRAIVDEEYEEALRLDAEANKKSAAGAALDLEDNAHDDERARKTLAELDLDDETLARMELVKTILKERKDRSERATWRRCVAMARSTLGDEPVADYDDFARFVHRGLDTERVDDRELRRLYANCLQHRPGSRAAVADVLTAERLAECVEKGQWSRHWARYVQDARRKALDRGPCGASAAVFGATCADPIAARPFPPLTKSLSLPRGYVRYLLSFYLLPLLWPVAGLKRLGVGGGVAEALHVWRYVLPKPLRRVRDRRGELAALFLCVTPMWTLAALTLAVYFAYRPEFLLVDVAIPSAVTGALVSAAAACAAAARDAGDREHPGRGDGGQLRPSHAFPGGRTRIPDDESRIVQSHPRLDTVEERRLASEREAAASGVGSGSGAVGGAVGSGAGAVRRAAGVSGNGSMYHAPRPLGRDSAKESASEGGSPEGPGAPATVRVRAETVSRNGSNPSSWESNGFDRGDDANDLESGPPRRLPPLGGVGGVGGGRGRRGRAAAGAVTAVTTVTTETTHRHHSVVHVDPPAAFRNDEAREREREALARGDRRRAAFKGEVFDAIKKPISEKDVVDAICRRADEESAKTYLIGSRTPSLELRLLMFAVALALACVPPLHRGVHGVEIFGGAERVTVCVDQIMPESVMNLMGFSKCSKLLAEEMAAEKARQDALLATGNYTYAAPPSPAVGSGASVDDLVLTETTGSDAGSSAGRVIVGGAVLWTTIATYFALNAARWTCARCYEHHLRCRLFSACVDPQEAALFDVPYVNVRHAWLPWMRIRIHLQRTRHLERAFATCAVTHLFVVVAGLVVAAGLACARIYTSPYQDVHSAPAACLGAALVLSLPLWLACTVASKTYALQEEDETLMHEERWKMTLDGVGDWRRHAAMADVADQVRRRNAKAWPTFGGVRAGPGTATASAVLCLFLLAAFLAVAALDSGGGPKEGASGDQLRDYVEVNFAYSHKYAEALMDRLLSLADNVTATRSGVADANVAISQLDNTSPRKTHDLVVAMSDCMSCAAPAGETKPRPWYADRTVEAAEAAAHRLYYRRVPTWAQLCTDGGMGANYTAPGWCADPVGEDPPLGKAQCTAVDATVEARCVNLGDLHTPPPAPPPPMNATGR